MSKFIVDLKQCDNEQKPKKIVKNTNSKSDDVIIHMDESHPEWRAQIYGRMFFGYPSQFVKNFPVKEFIEYEKNVSSVDCIDESRSIYNQSVKKKINGLNMCILKKDKHLYKGMNGFITQEMEKKYLQEPKVMWFAALEYSYMFIQKSNCGLNVYKLKNDLYLLNIYDDENLPIILSIIRDLCKAHKLTHNLYDFFNAITGFKMTIKEQLAMLKKVRDYNIEGGFWQWDNVIFKKPGHLYCMEDKQDNFNPLHTYLGILTNDKIIFKVLFDEMSKRYNIDGFIRPQHKSTFEPLGCTLEEIILPSTTVLNKLMQDMDSPMHWVNWKSTKYKIPRNGFATISGFVMSGGIIEKINFYLNNNPEKIRPKKYGDFSVLSYNVHSWINIKDGVDMFRNIINILNMIKKIDADIVVLEEFDLKFSKFIEKKLVKCGYVDSIIVKNGGPITVFKNHSYVFCCSKKKFENKTCVDLSVKNMYRQSAIIDFKNIKIAGVHLEVGTYFHIFDKSFTDDENVARRITQLKKLFEYEPDIITGDFNFNIKSKETDFILTKYALSPDTHYTTPFDTRVDLVFYNPKKLQIVKTKTFKCNYSDHLPIITYFKII